MGNERLDLILAGPKQRPAARDRAAAQGFTFNESMPAVFERLTLVRPPEYADLEGRSSASYALGRLDEARGPRDHLSHNEARRRVHGHPLPASPA